MIKSDVGDDEGEAFNRSNNNMRMFVGHVKEPIARDDHSSWRQNGADIGASSRKV